MKCDELTAYNVVATADVNPEVVDSLGCTEWAGYDKDKVDEAIAEMKEENATLRGANKEKTERIVELQKQVDELDGVKKSAELILLNLLDCGLIKEWYFNGKFNAILKADDPHLKIAELKQKLENAKATAYAESVDAGMRERRLKRALWIHRAIVAKLNKEGCKEIRAYNPFIGIQEYQWEQVEAKCRAMAEKFK